MIFKICIRSKIENCVGSLDSHQRPESNSRPTTVFAWLIIFGFVGFSPLHASAFQDATTVPQLGNEPQTQTNQPPFQSPAFNPGPQNPPANPANPAQPAAQQPNQPKSEKPEKNSRPSANQRNPGNQRPRQSRLYLLWCSAKRSIRFRQTDSAHHPVARLGR